MNNKKLNDRILTNMEGNLKAFWIENQILEQSSSKFTDAFTTDQREIIIEMVHYAIVEYNNYLRGKEKL